MGHHKERYWLPGIMRGLAKELKKTEPDLVIANDLDALPLALTAKPCAKVLFDAHEYSPKEWEDVWRWRLFHQPYVKALCKEYLKKADAMITVSKGIADAFTKEFNVEPKVVRNALCYQDLRPSTTDYKKIRFVHHGGACRSRQIEKMIRVIGKLETSHELHLFLVPNDPRYLSYLKKQAKKYKNIYIHPALPYQQLLQTLNQYDAGLYLLPPNSFNSRWALPNKFFDFIQARLAIVIGPSPEMASLVRKHNLGTITRDFSENSLLKTIQETSPLKIEHFKQNAHRAAKLLSFEKEKENFLEVVNSQGF